MNTKTEDFLCAVFIVLSIIFWTMFMIVGCCADVPNTAQNPQNRIQNEGIQEGIYENK